MKVRILAVLMIALFTLFGAKAQAQSETRNTPATTIQVNKGNAYYGHSRHCSHSCRNHCPRCRHERRPHRAHARYHRHGHRYHHCCAHRCVSHRKKNKIYHG